MTFWRWIMAPYRRWRVRRAIQRYDGNHIPRRAALRILTNQNKAK